MLHIIRAVFLVVVLAVTISFAFQLQELSGSTPAAAERMNFVYMYILIPPLAAVGVILVDMFWRRKRLNVLGGLFFGLVAGLVIAYVITLVFNVIGSIFPDLLLNPVFPLAKWLLGAMAVFLCVTIVLQTKDEFRFIIPYVEFSKNSKGNQPMLLDTSAIIDGRIADIVETKILQSELVVPRFVLAELQTIADSADKLKRNRGRRGLDSLQRLQNTEITEISILEVHVPTVSQAPDVDAKLVALGEHLNAKIVTNDYNLNKVASLRGVEVININDLANALKPVVLPGEQMEVKIIKQGEEAGQGIGYLDDGTMIVVDRGRGFIGKMIPLTVTSVLQTSAGRMIFGKAEEETAKQTPTEPKA